MKTIGLLGGMSWESSAVYYNLINEKVREMLGGFHSCKSLMLTVDFAEVEVLQHAGEWGKLDEMMAAAARQLESAGADIIVLCTNTMHLCHEAILKSISIPFLHIAEAVGLEIKKLGLNKVGLLGTKFTMEKDFYKKYINHNFGIDVITPSLKDMDIIHRIIYQELVQGEIKDTSREDYKKIIKKLQDEGAQGVILGCTEIPLLISDNDIEIKAFDTTRIHAEKSVEWALSS